MRNRLFFTLLFLLLPTTLLAGAMQLAETGQTSCYDRPGNIINCAGTGQDGEVRAGAAWPSPRFTDNGDQTITDLLNGLMWTRDAASPGPAACTPGIQMNWQQSLNHVTCLNNESYLGYSDWRLPNVVELISLTHVEHESGGAVWLNSQGFLNIPNWQWWSSTTYPYYTLSAYLVEFERGGVISARKVNNSAYTWPVRGGQSGVVQLQQTGQTRCYNESGVQISCAGTGQDGEYLSGVAWPSPRFTDNGDQTVTDELTGLIWSQSGNSPGPAICNPGGNKLWEEAFAYVDCLNDNNYLGFSDWRLANRNELYCLTNADAPFSYLWLNSSGFVDIQKIGHWSSTGLRRSPNTAILVSTVSDSIYSGWKDPSFAQAWAVRSGLTSTLTVNKSGNGGGSVTPVSGSLTWNGTKGSASYPEDSVVNLTAVADTGSVFMGWSEGGCSGTGVCQASLTANTSVTATFALNSAPPTNLTVPATAINGKAKITWNASTTPDARYELQMDSGIGFTIIYVGSKPTSSVSGLTSGSYTFRVRATSVGYAPSEWVTSGACVAP